MEIKKLSKFNRNKLIGMILWIILSIVAAIIRIFVMKQDNLSLLYTIVILILLLGLGIFSFFVTKKTQPCIQFGLSSSVFVSSLCGFLFLTALIFHFLENEDAANTNQLIEFLSLIFTVFAGIYFFLSAAGAHITKKIGIVSLFSLAVPLFYAFRILSVFISNSATPLVNDGGYNYYSMIAIMLFFLFESRVLLGKKTSFLYFFLGATSILLSSIYNIPYLIQWFVGAADNTGAIYSLLNLFVTAYIIVRLSTSKEIAAENESAGTL